MNANFYPNRFSKVAKEALDNADLQNALTKAMHHSQMVRNQAVQDFSDWEEMRNAAYRIRKYTLDHLDELLLQFEENCVRNGVQVHYAWDAQSACQTIHLILSSKSAKRIVKSKSMTTEEIHLNHFLESNGYEVVETDLGEYIVQLRNEPPSHITGPAIHLNRKQIADLFHQKLQLPYTEDPEELTKQARTILRQRFLTADAGISGVNFACADSGKIVIIENEGNVRLTTSLPNIHIALCGIEKILAKEQYLPLFLRMLARSATGQRINVYTNFLSRPRQPNELDGPKEIHVILLDNNRSKMLKDIELRESLLCIRCGACLNVCPIYRRAGGHAYGYSYMGPIGAVITPQLIGLQNAHLLPYASTLCTACGDVCPVKVPLPQQLLTLRQRIAEQASLRPWLEKVGFKIWKWMFSNNAFYVLLTYLLGFASKFGMMKLFKPWSTYRAPLRRAPLTFRQQWKKRTYHER
ncbi:MAG: LutB/LldF family L-lactate oxidation iron-sulfur protein [bacterium]|nr:LutB/LldF family L-lactate oxidation iron-sulfur protein [bacterium]